MDPLKSLVPACALIALGCGEVMLTMPVTTTELPRQIAVGPPPQRPIDPKVMNVGVAQIDITPNVGMGLFGHGPDSRVAEGIRMRLQCQAFVFLGPSHAGRPEALAMVICDLGQPSMLLQREVAARLRTGISETEDRGIGPTAPIPIGADRLIVAATHTHDGPAHYFSATNLSGPFSARVLGRDPAFVDFLADRIAFAVFQAWQSLAPAELTWHHRRVFRLSRNRSIAAFDANPVQTEDMRRFLSGAAVGCGGQPVPALPDDRTLVAIDPQMSVLTIERDSRRIGTLVVFGVHPTVFPNTEVLFGGDLFGATRRLLAKHLGEETVVGIFNGVEGDVTANVTRRDADACAEIAERLAGEIASTVNHRQSRQTSSPYLDVAYRELDVPGAKLADGEHVCTTPEIGSASAGGAPDHPTALRLIPQFNPGVKSVTHRGCQHPKHPLITLEGPSVAGIHFPRWAPVVVAGLAGTLIATIPGEITVKAGQDVRDALAPVASGRPVVLLGLAQEYFQYITTDAEFGLQLYEGASNLYGPRTARFLGEQLSCLAQELSGAERCTHASPMAKDTVNPIGYATGTVGDHFGLPFLEPCIEEVGRPAVSYLPGEGVVAEIAITLRNPVRFWEPARAQVVVRDPSTGDVVADLSGFEIVLMRDRDDRSWLARWVPGARRVVAQKRYTVAVTSCGVAHTSEPFLLSFPAPTPLKNHAQEER